MLIHKPDLFLDGVTMDCKYRKQSEPHVKDEEIVIIIIIIYSLEFFTSALADGLSLEYEWQQVSSSLQDSSQYSGRSQ